MSGATIALIQVPYDSGHRGARLGAGPIRLVEAGLPEALRRLGHEVQVVAVETRASLPTENGTAFELAARLAERVRETIREDRFPLVLAGNCFAALGTVAGLGAEGLALVWLDAHGDFNTPETTRTAFLDGMPLAAVVGRCWTGPALAIPGFRPLPERRVLLIGARDLDPEERPLLEASDVTLLPPPALRATGVRPAVGAALERAGRGATRAYLHVDLDVLDPAEARASGWAAAGGLSTVEAVEVVAAVAARLPIAALTLACYDPDRDPEARIPRIAEGIAAAALESGRERRG